MGVAGMRIDGPRGAEAVERLMRPKSVAIVGISSKPGSAGHTVLANLTLNKFPGDIYLVGRSGGEIEGRKVHASIDELPEGVGLAVFTLPAAGVKEALEGCARRKVRAAVVFASGFAEVGNTAAQEELQKIAAEGNISMLGPNCLGYSNFVDGLQIGFASASPVGTRVDPGASAIAILSQSGGFMAHLRQAFEGRNIPTSFTISPGNEAGPDLVDFIEYFILDKATKAIVLYAEDIRRPNEFLAVAKKARAAGKPIVMMHPGRSAAAQAATNSHTGALAGNDKIYEDVFKQSGVILNIADDAALKEAFTRLYANVKKHAPDITLDGALVEKMSPKGLELVVGANRDPKWGPAVLVGLGGVMVEALGDVRLIPADLGEAGIIAELGKLKAAKLLGPFRGAPAVDVEAVAKVVMAVGQLMRTQPEIMEIDVNPLMAYAKGQGVMALDALIVTK